MIDPIRPERGALRRLLAPLLVLGLLIVVLSACTGGAGSSNGVATLNSADPAASAAPSASLNPQDALLAYARCMREHGIDMPDPQFDDTNGKFQVQIGTGGSKPTDKQKVDAAQQACQHFMEGVAFGPGGGQIDQETQDKLLAFSRCMREHGIDFPDPQFDDGGRVMIGGNRNSAPAFDPNSQKFKDAQEACRSLLPGGGKDFGVSVGKGGNGPSTNSGSQP